MVFCFRIPSGCNNFRDIYCLVYVVHLDTSKLVGEDIVSFEDIIRDGITVGTHADINDKDQTVAVIDFETTALDTKTGTHESAASESAVIVDKVKYTNLFSPGEEYVLKGTLIHKKTTPVSTSYTFAKATYFSPYVKFS